MKKYLLFFIVSLTTLSAHAGQVGVDVYGRVRTVVENKTVNNVTTSAVQSDTSHIGFRVTENLGDGLKVLGVIETSVNSDGPTDTSKSFGDRVSTVGFSYKEYGRVNIGRDEHALFNTTKKFDFNNTKYGTLYKNIHNLRGTRLSNGVFLHSTPAKNIEVNYQTGFSETSNSDNINVYSLKVNFDQFKTNLVATRYENPNTQAYSNFYGVRFEPVKGTKVAVSRSINRDKSTEVVGSVYALEHKVKNIDVLLSHGKSDTVDSSYSIGARYNLSKRTKVEVHKINFNYKDNKKDTNQYGIVIEHNF